MECSIGDDGETLYFNYAVTWQTRARPGGLNGTMAAFRDHMLRRRSDTDYGDVDWLYGHSVLH